MAFFNNDKNIKRLEFSSEKVKYTIREGLKVFELALSNPNSNSGATFWLKVERDNLIFRRTGESMRAFWKLNRSKGIEKYLLEAVKNDDIRYSHMQRPLPSLTVHHSNYALQSEARMFSLAIRGNKVVHFSTPEVNGAVTYNLHESIKNSKNEGKGNVATLN